MELANTERLLTSPKKRYNASDHAKGSPKPEFLLERRKVTEIAKYVVARPFVSIVPYTRPGHYHLRKAK
jgi:hypothetical protein